MRALLLVQLLIAVQAAGPNEVKTSASSGQDQTELSSKRMKAEAATGRVKACGFKKVRTSPNQFGGYWINVEDEAATNEQLTCAARVRINELAFEDGIFFPRELDRAYSVIRTQLLEDNARMKAEAAIPLMSACGFKNLHVERWESLEYGIEVEDKAATAKQLSCAARVQLNSYTDPSYELSEDYGGIRFPPALGERYAPIHEHMAKEASKRRNRALLQSRGVLSRVPKYHPGANALTFARKLEVLCGPSARGAFRMSRRGAPTTGAAKELPGQVTWNEDSSADYDTQMCLYAAVELSGLPSDSLYADD